MKRSLRIDKLIALARSKQTRMESRLRGLRSEYGHPLPGYLCHDPILRRLGNEIVEIEYELYGLSPELTVEQLYPDDLLLEDYFCIDALQPARSVTSGS